MTCDICQGSQTIKLPTYRDVSVLPEDFDTPTLDDGWKMFPCPQCVPVVPYRRVRAKKITAAYDAQEFGRLQMPIERTMAARFGEYLYREGLIRFTTTGTKDFGPISDKITITGHLGVVSREDVVRSGAVEEVAFAPTPPLPKKLTRQERERAKVSDRAVRWQPPSLPGDDVVTDEFDEPKDAISNRFSGLEI